MFQGAVNPAQMMNWYPNQQQTFSNYQQFQQPVMQPQLQRPTISGLPGKVVNSTNEITPSDVPMDGSTSLFPMTDGSVIFAKTWNTDGTIRTEKYIKEPEQTDTPQVSPFDQIMQRLDSIEKVLNRKPNNYHNDKKGGDNNG